MQYVPFIAHYSKLKIFQPGEKKFYSIIIYIYLSRHLINIMNTRQTLRLIIPFIALSSCKSNTVSSNNSRKHDVVGHYQFLTTGYYLNCESVKHEIDLDTAEGKGTFLYHVFCLPFDGDSTGASSLLKPCNMIGSWTYTTDSSVVKLVAANGRIVKLKIEGRQIINATNETGRDIMGTLFFLNSE
jgi:hypothetical protein